MTPFSAKIPIDGPAQVLRYLSGGFRRSGFRKAAGSVTIR
jgi:hypothetical protein